MRNLLRSSSTVVGKVTLFMWVLAWIWQQPSYATPSDTAAAELAAVGKALEAAFNAHDAPALGSLWDEQAVHHSKSTGVELSGRQAITDTYARLFAEEPECTLSVRIESARLDSETVATVVGVAEVDHPGSTPTLSQFEARLARVAGKWLLTRVDETDLLVDASTALRPLRWLVGRWVADSPDGRVVNEFHFVDEGTFLVRNYWRENKEGLRVQGTQVTGWDAEQSCVRTWLFDSTGSFGEGYWQTDGTNRWVNKLALKLADGRRASITQVLQRVSDDQFTLQLVDRDIDGAAQPNGPIATLVRQSDRSTERLSDAESRKGELP